MSRHPFEDEVFDFLACETAKKKQAIGFLLMMAKKTGEKYLYVTHLLTKT